MRRALLLAVVAGTALAIVPADAATPKPITKTYDVTAPLPWPTSAAEVENGCEAGQETLTKHVEPFVIPAAGTLVIEMTGYVGDWDLILQNAAGANLGESANDDTGNTGGASEKFTFKKGKAKQAISIVACNWLGGPTATVKYTFTYAPPVKKK